MQHIFIVVLATLLAGAAAAQSDGRPKPTESGSKVPPVQYRSAFDGYQPFAEQELRNWRRANEEVRAAGGHAGHKPGQGAAKATAKPQPEAPAHSGHGAHK